MITHYMQIVNCSNRKLHELAAFMHLVEPPVDDKEDVYDTQFLLEILVNTESCLTVKLVNFYCCERL